MRSRDARPERVPVPTSDLIMQFMNFMIVIVIVMPIEWNVCYCLYGALPYFNFSLFFFSALT